MVLILVLVSLCAALVAVLFGVGAPSSAYPRRARWQDWRNPPRRALLTALWARYAHESPAEAARYSLPTFARELAWQLLDTTAEAQQLGFELAAHDALDEIRDGLLARGLFPAAQWPALQRRVLEAWADELLPRPFDRHANGA